MFALNDFHIARSPLEMGARAPVITLAKPPSSSGRTTDYKLKVNPPNSYYSSLEELPGSC